VQSGPGMALIFYLGYGMLQAFSLCMVIKTANINVKTTFIKTCLVEYYWQCSDETVHYKSDETVNFCGFRCVITSPIPVFINVVFYIYYDNSHLATGDAVKRKRKLQLKP